MSLLRRRALGLVAVASAWLVVPASCHLAAGLDDFNRVDGTGGAVQGGSTPGGGGQGGGGQGGGGQGGGGQGGSGATGGSGGGCTADSMELNAEADAWLNEMSPTYQSGGEPRLNVALWPPDGGTEDWHVHSVVRFDLTPPSAGAVVTSAQLCLQQVENLGEAGILTVAAYPLGQDWLEAYVSWINRTDSEQWDTQGGATINEIDRLELEARVSAPRERCWDVESYVAAVWGGATDEGVLLAPIPIPTSQYGSAYFHSREATAEPGPSLRIDYCL